MMWLLTHTHYRERVNCDIPFLSSGVLKRHPRFSSSLSKTEQMCLYSYNACWSLFSVVEKGLKHMTRGRERDRLKWIQLQLFKVLTGVVEENPIGGCAGSNKHLKSILLQGPEKVFT